jgi:predicted nucleic acid-binding protein
MTFADIPAGASVFIDANTFVYDAVQWPGLGPPSTALLDRIDRQEITGLTSTHILAEIAHRVMTIEAADRYGWPMAWIANRLRRHPTEVQSLTRFRRVVDDFQASRIRALTVTASDIATATALSQQFGLLTNDALIIAVMRANNLTALASHDADFDRVPGLTRFAPG